MHRLIDNPQQIDDTTQIDQQSSHDLDYNTPPSVLQRREWSTQSRYHIKRQAVDAYQVSKRRRIPEALEKMYTRT
jgi:hypothetical protein